MAGVSLNEVFGINRQCPYTYTDRAQLDDKFSYYLKTDRHIVIAAPSKQGKSILRRRHLPDDQCLAISCTPDISVDSIYQDVLRKLGATIPLQIVQTTSRSSAATEKDKAEFGFEFQGFTAKASKEIVLSRNSDEEDEVKLSFTPTDAASLSFIAETIAKSGKRVVIDDFHYLPIEQRVRLAYDLKAMLDLGALCVIIGIWNEPSLLTYYNGDLVGRIEEIPIYWANDELRTVLQKGQHALNIKFSNEVEDRIVADAVGNVGLLQKIAEAYCRIAGIRRSHEEMQALALNDASILGRVASEICEGLNQRYGYFVQTFRRGMKQYEQSEIKSYEKILEVALAANDDELLKGLHIDTIQERAGIRRSDLSAALKKIDKLQAKNQISPPVLSYSTSLQTLRLVDQSFLYFKHHANLEELWNEDDGQHKMSL